MIRKLTSRCILKNENATVTALIKREMVQKYESDTLLEKTFNGSLSVFFSAFLQDKKLTRQEAKEIQKMIEEAIQ